MATIDDNTFLGSVEKLKDIVNEGVYADETRAANLEKTIKRTIKQGIYWFERQRDLPYMKWIEELTPNSGKIFVSKYLWRTIQKVELWAILDGSEIRLVRDLICAPSREHIPQSFRDNYNRSDDYNTGVPRFYIKSTGVKWIGDTVLFGSSTQEKNRRTILEIFPAYSSENNFFIRIHGYKRTIVDETISEDSSDFTHFFFQEGWDLLESYALTRIGRYLQDADLVAHWSPQFVENFRAFNIELDSEFEGDEYADEFRLEYLGENMDDYDLRALPSRRN